MSLSTTVSGAQTPEMSTEFMSLFTNKYIESTTELPELSNLQPEKIIQSSGNIRGWIDVVGFRDVIRMDGIYYINGSPADKALIQYDAWGEDVSVDSVTKTTTVYVSGNNIVAQMYVTLFWHYYYSCNCNKDGCSTCRKDVIEHATFYDYEPIPERFISPGNQPVLLKQYNGSIFKPKVLNFNISPGIISYSVNATNGSLKQYVMFGTVEFTNKNVPFMNLTKTDYFIKKGKDISRLNHEITFTSNLTDITFKTPFNTVNANITSKTMPATSVNPAVFGILFIVIIFLGGIYVMANCR